VTVRRLSAVTSKSEAPGVQVRQLKRTEDVELKVLELESGNSTPFHAHPHAHDAVMLSGAGVVRLEDGEQPLAAGDVLSIAPNQPHAIHSHGSEPLRFVCMDSFIERG
jgi:quercetin dioxygenase-like cupin family protein